MEITFFQRPTATIEAEEVVVRAGDGGGDARPLVDKPLAADVQGVAPGGVQAFDWKIYSCNYSA